MDLSGVTPIAAIGALLISIGGDVYFYSRIEEINVKLDLIQKNFVTQISKMSQHDDDIKIVSSKYKDMEINLAQFVDLKNNVLTLGDEVSEELQRLNKKITEQSKNIEDIYKKLEIVSESIGIKLHNTPGEKPILKKKSYIKKGGIKNKEKRQKKEILAEIDTKDEENIFEEMNSILSS